jgi:S-adenosylmethionine decarboxylase proenzyme
MGPKSTNKNEARVGGISTKQTKMRQVQPSKSVASGSQVQSFRPYDVYVSMQFVIGSFLLCIIITFALGIICHTLLINSLVSSGSINMDSPAAESFQALQNLPKLYYEPTKPIPLTMYSSKTFTTDGSIHASSATVLAEKKQQQQPDKRSSNVCTSLDGSQGQCRLMSTEIASSAPVRKNETPNGDAEVHEPAGQHLLVDMQNVDSEFLNSEILIAQAMVDIVSVSGLTMLSYHCHELQPTGVSCVGVLLESHISVHTWPDAGVILLDLFTCGSGSLFPLLPLLKKYFGISRKDTEIGPDVNPNMLWAHKKRGFKNDENLDTNMQGWDLDKFVVGWIEHEMKTIVASVETEYQTIDIYDVVNPRFLEWSKYYAAHLSEDKTTYYAQNPQFFAPDRMVFINGVVQSRRQGETAYHEALVHPAMFSHPEPKRVAIIGGGEGATLREVLKHKSVEQVFMIEIDKDMVEVSKQYLPEWSDCSNLIVPTKDGTAVSYASCFDDPRVTLHLEDATAWFVQKYKNLASILDSDKFDVIIMDSL